MRLTLLGVRGSTPAPGADFVRYGGHTSCVAASVGDEPPALVLDAGTGLRSMSRLLGGAPFRGDLVLTHLHWDHVQGLPFSAAVDHPDAVVRLHVPVGSERDDPVERFARTMSPPNFPIGPEGLLGQWEFVPLLPGPLQLADGRLKVTADRIRHKGGPTYGLRLTGPDGASAAYLPDHLLTAPGDRDGIDLVSGVDLLLHDGQFTSSETARADDYGHTTIEAAVDYADRARVRELVLLHHHPDRTDAQVDALASRRGRTPDGRPVRFAAEGDVIAVC
ncbi:MAG: MBL fold metallo-hydrolase [Actinomycetota bacterium]|nr:MBL fold metallo-hydrolase [Actinomycetota bacterium]